MSKKSHILEQYQLLNEKLLTSEFTFGFELEGIVEYGSEIYHQINDIIDDDDDSSSIYRFDNYSRYDALGKIIDSMLTDDISPNMRKSLKGSSVIQRDGSVKPYSNSDYENDKNEDEYDYYYSYGYNDDDIPFEYSSPIIPCTPNWFGKVIKLLKDLKYDGIYTNNTCGFHTHLRFGSMDERDVVWIYCNMASDPEFVNIFSQLDRIKLFNNEYANYDSIIKLGNAIQERDYQKIFSYLTTDKYRVIRIHPQGTLEWRGPRGFMDNGVGFSYIKKFFKLLLKFINKIKTYMDTNTLTGTTIEKKEFFDNLTSVSKKISHINGLEFITGDSNINLRPKNTQSLSYKSAMKLKDVLIDKPEMIVPLIQKNQRSFEKFIKTLNLSSSIKTIINKVLDSKAFNILSFDKKRNVMKVFIDNVYPITIVKMKLGAYMTEQDIQKLYNQELLNNKTGLSSHVICQFIYIMHDAGCLKSLKQIEELFYKSISLNNFSLSSYFINFGITANNDGRETMEEIIGEKNLVKLTLFVLNASSTKEFYGSLYISDVNLNYFKDRIKEYGLAEKWDKIVFRLIKKYKIPHELLINPLNTEQLFYLIHNNKDMSSLSSEDKAKIRAYLH